MVEDAQRRPLADLLGLIALLWLVECVDLALQATLGLRLDYYGLRPMELRGLFGLVTAHFLHVDFSHLIANTLSLLLLGLLAMAYSARLAWRALALAALTAGGFTWCFAQPGSIHIGASGCVFGLFGWLLANGLFRSSCLAFLLSLVVFLLYGGALIGLLPNQDGALQISWQMHLGGFIGGVWASWLQRHENRHENRHGD